MEYNPDIYIYETEHIWSVEKGGPPAPCNFDVNHIVISKEEYYTEFKTVEEAIVSWFNKYYPGHEHIPDIIMDTSIKLVPENTNLMSGKSFMLVFDTTGGYTDPKYSDAFNTFTGTCEVQMGEFCSLHVEFVEKDIG